MFLDFLDIKTRHVSSNARAYGVRLNKRAALKLLAEQIRIQSYLLKMQLLTDPGQTPFSDSF